MALINCPECGKEVSDKAENCIHCGFPLRGIPADVNIVGIKDNKKKINKKAFCFIGCILCLLLFFIYAIFFSVPHLKGKTEKLAIESLDKKNINYTVEYEYNNDYENGIVVKQNYNFLYPIFKVENIKLTVCKGQYVDISDIENVPINDAIESLRKLSDSFEIKQITDTSKTVVLGNVIKIEVSDSSVSLSKVPTDSKLIITVCSGMIKEVPSLIGKNLEDAEQIIEKLGLKTNVNYDYSMTVDKGVVISSDNEYIEGLDKKINITISQGIDDRLDIPNVIGRGLDVAKEKIDSVGCSYTVKYIYEDISDYDVIGEETSNMEKVYSQSIYGKVDEPQQVVLNVNKPSLMISLIDFDINSAGGVDTTIHFKNLSDKQVKYVNFYCSYFDRVGEKAYCSITGNSEMKLQFTGPIGAGNTQTSYWQAVIYNYSFAAIRPDTIEVEFIDGTVQNLNCDGRYWYSSDYYNGTLCDE